MTTAHEALRALLSGCGVADDGASVSFLGHDPILPTRFLIGTATAAGIAAVAVVANQLWMLRGGREQRLELDVAGVAATLRGEHGGLTGSTQHFILNEEMECMQMTRRNGRGFSSAEKTELWDRWQRGESLKAIGRVFGKPSSSIYFQLSPHGGIRPSPRRRSRLALSLWEREEISRGIVARHSIRSMALLLSRSPSTVSREVRRNGGYDQYRAALADDMAWARARRPKRCKLALSSGMRRVVAMKLGLNWSPEQIAGWLKRAHPGAGSYQVSHETIYRSLFVQARGVLKKELLQHLRSKRTIRRSKEARRKGVGRGQITDMVSIRERPASVEDRAVPGHWEGDLLSGSKNSYIATLVERQTRYVMLVKVANKETLTVVSALIQAGEEAADRALQVPDLGPGQGTRGPSPVQPGDRHRCLLL